MIAIINYGLGNLGSITNMLRYIGKESKIINHPEQITNVEKLILPGVGAFDAGVEHLRKNGWIEPLNDAVIRNKIPILGICLGMQLMANRSEEGTMQGLKWIDGEAHKFVYDVHKNLKIPHMGWTEVAVVNPSALFPDLDEENRFYFVHSYYVKLENPLEQMLMSNYYLDFTAGFHRDNIYGVQFHPEKSHKFGMRFLERFANIK
jgi:glutamine amidotransferase